MYLNVTKSREIKTSVSLSSGGISITWKEPLPIQAISDDNQIHSSYTQLLEGTINATLSWLFSLSSDLTFSGVNLRFNGEIIGAVEQSGDVVVASGFEDKFDLRWIPYERVILFVFNVTTEVNGTFGCDVLAKKVGTLTFKSTTQVDVVGKPNVAFNNDFQSEQSGKNKFGLLISLY